MKNREKTLNIIFLSIIVLLPILYYSNILFSGRMLFGTDWLSAGGYIKRAFILDSIKNGNGMPFWNPNIFAGIPTGEGFWGDIFYPISNFLKLFFSLTTSWILIFILHPMLAGIGTYLFMKNKTKDQFISFFSAIIYMFTSVILSETYAGHDGRVIVTTLFPLLIYFLDKGIDYRRMLDFSLAGLIGGFMLLSGHIQSSYYAIVIGIFYVSFIHISRTYEHKLRNLTWIIALIIGFIFSFINRYFGFLIFSASILSIPWILDKKFRKETIWMYLYLLMFIVVTIIIATIQYLPLLKFLPETAREVERGYRYSVSWSMGLSEIVDMFFPGFTGVNVGKINSYWGENPFKLHLRYIGIIPMLLAMGVIVTRKKNEIVTFFTIIFFTGIIIALGGGTPIYRMFYNLFPYFDKFRAPDLAFFITSFAGCILAGYFFISKVSKKTMTIIVATIVLIGIIIVFIPGLVEGVCGSFIRGFEVQKEQIVLKTNIMSLGIKNISGTVFFIIITALLAFLSIYYLDRKYINYVLIAITIITASDLLIRNRKYIQSVENPKQYYSADNIVKKLTNDKSLFRVFPFNYNGDDYLTLFGINSVSGSHPSPFMKYQQFVNNPKSVMFNPIAIMQKKNRIKLLNVKYMIFPVLPEDTTGYPARDKQIIAHYNTFFNELGFERWQIQNDFMILKTDQYLPRIFAVNKYIITNNFDETMKIIDEGNIDFEKYVILSESPSGNYQQNDTINYNITNLLYSNNKVSFDIQCDSDCILVFLDQYYKSWKCKVNNEDVEIISANAIFRAIELEKGEHKIKFYFDSSTIVLAFWISLLGVLFIVIQLVYRLIIYKRNQKSDKS